MSEISAGRQPRIAAAIVPSETVPADRRLTMPQVCAGQLYLGGLASALAFILWAFGLRHFRAGQAAIFTNLSPLVGVVVAALLLREAVSLVQVGTGVVSVGGVWLATRRAVTGPRASDEAA